MPLDLREATSRRRAGMVDRLTTDGVLTDPLLRDALFRLPREVLLPHAYVRVSGPGADPIDWRLLDGSHPDDQGLVEDTAFDVLLARRPGGAR